MTAILPTQFLDLRSLANLEHMRFATRQRIEGAYSGRHRSRQQGGAGEFVDFREYSAGEDLKRLDWKVLARTGKSYLRLFQDETNLYCTLAIDSSGSMDFGKGNSQRGSKLEFAQYLTTALSHIIGRGQDQVGVAIIRETLDTFLAPQGGRNHAQRVQEILAGVQTQPTRNMSTALRELFQRTTRRGVLIFVSDFLMEDLEEVFSVLRLFRHRQSEVIALHLIDPDEERLPDGAAFRFEGLEKEGTVDCSPSEIRLLYERRFEAHTAAVRTLALAEGCDYRRVSTGVSYLQVLGDFLVERTG